MNTSGAVSDAAKDAIVDSTISVRQLKEMLDEREKGERDFVLIDVREQNEWDIVNIPGAVLIPKNEFLLGDALTRLPQDKPVVLHCKAGGDTS
jgi:adenylyltransferase/sulfurtransferase